MLLRASTLLLFSAAACSPAAASSLVVGQGWALSQERITVNFTNVTQDVALDFVPAEADGTSIQVLAARTPVALLAWCRPAAGKPMTATLATDIPRPRSFDVAYLLRGLSWRASYQLIVRADPDREDAPVSMDVDGRITIRNTSGGAWSNAALRLVGADARPQTADREHGMLELDESSPLADLWLPPAPENATAFAYDFDRPATLRANEERSLTFVSVERRNAERRYLFSSDDIPPDTIGPGKPLKRCIALKNDAEHGLGRDLPSGTAQIFIGSVRATLGESAWFDRTPASGEIRIELGPSQRVRGLRRCTGRIAGAPGQIEWSYEIEIRNDLDSPARVEIEEQPPAQQDWDVVRSDLAYEIRRRRLEFRREIPARDRFIIHYTIRVSEPKK